MNMKNEYDEYDEYDDNEIKNKVEEIEYKIFLKSFKWIVLYIVFLTGFSVMFSKAYADDSEVFGSYENIPVAFDLNENKTIMEKL